MKTQTTMLIILALPFLACAKNINTNAPPPPDPVVTVTKSVRSIKAAGITDNLTSSSLDLFGTDYWGPIASQTNGGDANFQTIAGDTNECYQNFCGVKNLTDNQTAWFEVMLTPNRESAGRRLHDLTFGLGVLGGPGAKIFCTGWQNGVMVFSNCVFGSMEAYKYSSTCTNWQRFNWYHFPTNYDLTLHFQVESGPNTFNYNGGANAAGVDFLDWEPNVVYQTATKIVRIEPQVANIGTQSQVGPFGDRLHTMRVSWSYGVGFLYTTTNLTTWTQVNPAIQQLNPNSDRVIVYWPYSATDAPRYFKVF